MTGQVSRLMLAPALAAAVGMVGAAQAAPRRVTHGAVRPAVAANQRVVPADTVVRVELEEGLSSRTARVGQTFMATLDQEDRSGFPEGTRFEGTVAQVTHATKEQPATLDVKFRRAFLPGGSPIAISGGLASLDEKDVSRTSSGRLASRSRKGKFEAKWVGYGAAGGAVLSTILGGSFLKGALIGAAGGAAYSYLKKEKGRKHRREVELDAGTDFGIRLANRVAFNDSTRYHYLTSTEIRDRDERDQDIRDRDRERDRRDRDPEKRDQ